MPRIILDPNLISQFSTVTGPTEICDTSGQVLGHFTPTPEQKQKLEPKISEEAIERRLQQGGGRSLQEILDDLAGKK